MNDKNVYKDMELFVRNEMLFIRDSLCNRYNGYGVVYAQIDNEEPRENRYCKTFCLDGDLAKDHDVFVKIHEWADRIINGGVAA